MAVKTITLTINGRPFPQTDMDDLVDMVVDMDIFLPAMFCLTFQDTKATHSASDKYMDTSTFPLGGTVSIQISAVGFNDSASTSVTLIQGEITSLEPSFSSDGKAFLRVRGYDRSHRLTRNRETKVFVNQSPVQIIQSIASAYGLSAQVDSSELSSLRYETFIQYNQTAWEYLWSQARLYGYQVYVIDRVLYFQKANYERVRAKAAVEWGKDLTSFEPRISLMGQVGDASAHGWDPKTKKEITAQVAAVSANSSPKIGFVKKGNSEVKTAFGDSSEVILDHPLITQAHAKLLATAELSARESNFIRASGYCAEGDPSIQAGVMLSVKNVGSMLSGSYYITKAIHHWSSGRYRVDFSASGSSPNTIYGLLSANTEQETPRINGLVTAIVTDITDPEKQGRVKVKFPWLPKQNGAELSSGWIRVISPEAGKDRGFYFLPEVNDEVIVGFEHGDPNNPYLVGALWNKIDKPPAGTAEVVAAQKVNQRVIRSRSGHLIILDDTQGKEQIIIQDSSGKSSIIMDTKKKTITLKSEGDFVIEAGGKFVVKSKNAVQVEATGALSLEGKQGAAIKCSSNQLDLKTAGAELSGMKVDVKSNTTASVNGTAMVEVKGAIVKIN